METGYKEIKITPTSEEEDIVFKVEEAAEGEDGSAVLVQPEAKPVEQPVEQAQQRPQRESRAQKRIKELLAKNAEKDAAIDQERREKADLQKQLLQGHASTKESFKTTLEGQIRSLNSQVLSAMKSGDSDLVVALNDQLMTAKMELQNISQDLVQTKRAVEQSESAQVRQPQPSNQVPERALEWIEDHPEFNTDPIFNGAAIAVNNQLLREGFDPNSDEFYSEINERLAGHFPKVFGVDDKSVLQLSGRQTSADSPVQPDVKPKAVDAGIPVSTKVRTVEQVVSGSSRPSANTIPKRAVTEVTLTPQDVKQAEAWGWSLERMAKRIAFIEKNRQGDDKAYTPIQIQ